MGGPYTSYIYTGTGHQENDRKEKEYPGQLSLRVHLNVMSLHFFGILYFSSLFIRGGLVTVPCQNWRACSYQLSPPEHLSQKTLFIELEEAPAKWCWVSNKNGGTNDSH